MTPFQPVSKDAYGDLFQAYIENADVFFPLIGNVLDGKQSGHVFTSAKNSYFIIHKFGFAQFFAPHKHTDIYDNFIETLTDKAEIKNLGLNTKLRIYCPDKNGSHIIKSAMQPEIQTSERMQMRLYSSVRVPNKQSTSHLINAKNINTVISHCPVNLDSRFWNNAKDFLNYGLGYYIKTNDHPAGLCYSAALSHNIAEIDIFISENHRKNGLGETLGHDFIARCQKQDIIPNWDCFTNNIASCSLAVKLGFKAQRVYDFYTIDLSHI